ncbi:non-structural maintenance of chromosomes element 3 homolog [Anneissia japonica]|uniref:non-structural maintenance of chromosomes element 3 homolog n=1 Tax=Anneissia japonica TaxID=1529436 RepID=UPI0014257E26|nr:non-structural maintenance of chromosomes element 3 homolog [Anneissia japonica]
MSKIRRKVVTDDSDESMDEDATQSQTQTLTQAQKVTATLSHDVINNMVSEVVQYMLVMEQKKLPIKRADINKHVLKDYSRAYTEIFRQASDRLKTVFGLEVTELELTSTKSKSKVYILLNTLDAEAQADVVDMSMEEPRMALLLIVLSIIFMNQGEMITDTILWHILKKLGINADEKEHEVFGDVKKILTTDFTKQLYLEYTRVPNSEVPLYEFRWGLRAQKEISKRKILEFVCKVYGNMRPEDWNTQYKEAVQSEGGILEQEAEGSDDE